MCEKIHTTDFNKILNNIFLQFYINNVEVQSKISAIYHYDHVVFPKCPLLKVLKPIYIQKLTKFAYHEIPSIRHLNLYIVKNKNGAVNKFSKINNTPIFAIFH